MKNDITILYVDDEDINLRIFTLSASKQYNVLTAKSGQEGLDILETNKDIKVVISDMKMPGMNGLEFIEIAKDKYNNIIYYILTGYDITEEISKALKKNMIHRYFRKPIDLKEVTKSIEEMGFDLIQ